MSVSLARPKSLSLRMRLTVMTSMVLFAVSLFLVVFFPEHMAGVMRRRFEYRAISLALVISSAAAPGLEFDDGRNVQELLDGLAPVPDFHFAVVRRANGTPLAGVNVDRAPPSRVEISKDSVISYYEDKLRIDRIVKARGGTTGSLTLGFTLQGLARERQAQLRVVGWASLLVFLIGCGASFVIGTILMGPLRRMTDVALRIASGDLSQPELGIQRGDEIGQMAAAFDGMLRLLRTLASTADRLGRGDLTGELNLEGQVGEAFSRMLAGQRELVRQIAEDALKLGGAAAQIYAVVQEQEQSTARQASGVEEVSRTMQSLLDSASNITDSARGVFDNAQRTLKTSEAMSTHVSALSGHTSRIAELLEVIRDIADRSDLLALNASLEATRAGDAGRAFSLVASEMRRLAERVTASVQDVKTLLTDIRSSGAGTVVATDEGRKLAESTTESARQITTVTQQQSTATGQVLESMREIAAILSESVTATRETRASIEMLRTTAEHFNAVVGKFKIDASLPDRSDRNDRGGSGR